MERLKRQGMVAALVPHQTAEENPAAVGLYAGVGFQPKYPFLVYTRQPSQAH